MIASADTLGSKLNRLIDLGLSSQQTEAKTDPNLTRVRTHTAPTHTHSRADAARADAVRPQRLTASR